ncbi:hypothetical protein HK101_002276 [Irineochytrium annulatum]|nr:hypothetical protein HK101_002276 [Irineochytrium annulatum]
MDAFAHSLGCFSSVDLRDPDPGDPGNPATDVGRSLASCARACGGASFGLLERSGGSSCVCLDAASRQEAGRDGVGAGCGPGSAVMYTATVDAPNPAGVKAVSVVTTSAPASISTWADAITSSSSSSSSLLPSPPPSSSASDPLSPPLSVSIPVLVVCVLTAAILLCVLIAILRRRRSPRGRARWFGVRGASFSSSVGDVDVEMAAVDAKAKVDGATGLVVEGRDVGGDGEGQVQVGYEVSTLERKRRAGVVMVDKATQTPRLRSDVERDRAERERRRVDGEIETGKAKDTIEVVRSGDDSDQELWAAIVKALKLEDLET